MLKSILLKNFKSYEEVTIPLAPLSILIGANASGKSNAIEGIRFLSRLATGQKLGNIRYDITDSNRLIRGRLEDLPNGKGDEFELGVETDQKQWNLLSIKLKRRADGFHISEEELTHEGATVPLYRIEVPSQGKGNSTLVAYNNFSQGNNKPRIECSDQSAIFTQLTSAATFNQRHKHSQEVIPPVVKSIENWLSAMLFLDPVPTRMRDYAFPSESVLQEDGRNLSAVLYNLWGGSTNKDEEIKNADIEPYKTQRASILSFIRSLPEQDVVCLSFLEEPRGAVMVKLTETFGGISKDYDASLLSDGTLRVLSVAAAMLSAPTGSLVIIEEIDNGVHPSRARRLLYNILEIAKDRSLRVLLSTHNPALLDAVPDSALQDVIFCYRSPSSGHSKIVRLQDIPDYPELISQDSLGGLVTNGTLERFVKQPQDLDKQARAMAWLEQINKGAEQ